jgi:hypothetical protein
LCFKSVGRQTRSLEPVRRVDLQLIEIALLGLARETDMSASTENSPDATAIRPFTIPIAPEQEVQALRQRVAATRWPDAETVPDHSQGVQLRTIQALARYWASD